MIVIAVAVPFALGQFNEQDPPATSEKNAPSANAANSDCTPSQRGVPITCLSPPDFKTVDNISFERRGANSYFFAGLPSDLSDLTNPPNFSQDQKLGHCDEWVGWLSQQDRVYQIYPSFVMGVSSKLNELVVIKSIESQIYNYVDIAGERTRIQCESGAGGNPGNMINVNTETKTTTWLNLTKNDAPSPMPPASLQLNGQGYEGVQVDIKSKKGRLYEGTILIAILVNGQERQIRLGTPKRPFRWVGGTLDTLTPEELGPAYDWSPIEQRWSPWAELTQ